MNLGCTELQVLDTGRRVFPTTVLCKSAWLIVLLSLFCKSYNMRETVFFVVVVVLVGLEKHFTRHICGKSKESYNIYVF